MSTLSGIFIFAAILIIISTLVGRAVAQDKRTSKEVESTPTDDLPKVNE